MDKQIICMTGPPGSGKSTLSKHLLDVFQSLGRSVKLFNLDPSNQILNEKQDFDICTLVHSQDIMEQEAKGPNAAILDAYIFLHDHIALLTDELNKVQEGGMVIFDMPGQVELYMQSHHLKMLMKRVELDYNQRILNISIVDCVFLENIQTQLGLLLFSLNQIIQLELPTLNVLNKVDLLGHINLEKNLEFYLNNGNFALSQYFESKKDDPTKSKKQNKMIDIASKLATVVEDQSLTSYLPLSVQEEDLVKMLVMQIDKSLGQCAEGSLLQNAGTSDQELNEQNIELINSKYINK